MADDGKPARIRWQTEPGVYSGFSGYVGTIEQALFRIYDPEAPDGEHALCSMLPGMGNKTSYGTEAEVKARAEEWLGEFASSLGAFFPADAEWGLRYGSEDAPAPVLMRYTEAEARSLVRETDSSPEVRRTIVTRQCGPWTVAAGQETQQEGNDHD
jgi:hypothetical protein